MKISTMDEVRSSRTDVSQGLLDSAYAEALSRLPLAVLRKGSGLTQKEMAALLGKSQAAVCKFEGRGDFLLSTLYHHVKAIGGSLSLRVTTDNSVYEMNPYESDGEITFALEKPRESTSENMANFSHYAEKFLGVKLRDKRIHSTSRSGQLWTRRPSSAEEINVLMLNPQAANDESKLAAA